MSECVCVCVCVCVHVCMCVIKFYLVYVVYGCLMPVSRIQSVVPHVHIFPLAPSVLRSPTT